MKRRPYITLAALLFMSVLFLFPFVYLIGGSLKSNDEALTQPAAIFGSSMHPENFIDALQYIDIPRQTMNSLIMTFSVTFGQIIIAAMAGYSFARIKFFARDWVFVIFLTTLIIPFELIFVPLYLMLARFGWIDTYWALIVPSLANPFAIFLFRQFFLTVPKELEESMYVDGAGYLTVFRKLMVPLAAPAITTVFILTWLAEWSGLIKPLLFTSSKGMQTLQVGLQFLNAGAQVTSPTIAWLMAGIVMASIPAILMFLILQRRFVESIAQTGLKG